MEEKPHIKITEHIEPWSIHRNSHRFKMPYNVVAVVNELYRDQKDNMGEEFTLDVVSLIERTDYHSTLMRDCIDTLLKYGILKPASRRKAFLDIEIAEDIMFGKKITHK
jgi:hypothetical protein